MLILGLVAAQPVPSTNSPSPEDPTNPPPLAVIEGWETPVEAAMAAAQAAGPCSQIDEPMVQALNPPGREMAVRRLRAVPVVRLSDAEAARLIGFAPRRGNSLAAQLFERYLTEMRQRRHRALVERRDSWSVADQRDLDRLTTSFAGGAIANYKPYLVRAVSRFGDGHGGPPSMYGSLCGRQLHLTSLTFSYRVPQSVRVPAVVFLRQAPERVVASAMFAM